MAQGGAKRAAASNGRIARTAAGSALAVVLVALLLRYFVFHGTHYGEHDVAEDVVYETSNKVLFAYALPVALQALAVKSLWDLAQPTLDPMSGRVVKVRADLEAGDANYWFDLLYLQWFMLFGALYTDYIWWLYCLPVGYGLYKGWSFISPFLGLGGGKSAGDSGADANQSAFQRRQQKARAEKAEKRQQQQGGANRRERRKK